MHSPWGMMYSIIEKTSYTMHDLMWRVRWIHIQMMLADSPKFIKKRKEKTKELVTEEDFLKAFNLKDK
jgi:hypothetical protein